VYSFSTGQIAKENNTFVFNQNQKKSPALAILYSALLPGMGELYAGNYHSGKYFTIAEASLWSIYIGMNYYQDLKKDNLIAYAKSNGGVDPSNKDDDYYATISQYKNIEQYNNDKAFNRLFNEMYNVDLYYWKWNSENERKLYRNLWLSSQNAKNNQRFIVGAMIINRLISIINAVRLTASYNKNLLQESSWDLFLDYDNNVNSVSNISLNYKQQF
jgi:hypothetical protein